MWAARRGVAPATAPDRVVPVSHRAMMLWAANRRGLHPQEVIHLSPGAGAVGPRPPSAPVRSLEVSLLPRPPPLPAAEARPPSFDAGNPESSMATSDLWELFAPSPRQCCVGSGALREAGESSPCCPSGTLRLLLQRCALPSQSSAGILSRLPSALDLPSRRESDPYSVGPSLCCPRAASLAFPFTMLDAGAPERFHPIGARFGVPWSGVEIGTFVRWWAGTLYD